MAFDVTGVESEIGPGRSQRRADFAQSTCNLWGIQGGQG